MTRELTLAQLSDFTNAKVGDKVYYLNGEIGEIIRLAPNDGFPIKTERESFTWQGQLLYFTPPMIFNRPVKIVAVQEDEK